MANKILPLTKEEVNEILKDIELSVLEFESECRKALKIKKLAENDYIDFDGTIYKIVRIEGLWIRALPVLEQYSCIIYTLPPQKVSKITKTEYLKYLYG